MDDNCESKIGLIPACFPPIKSGKYKIEVNQHVTIGQDFEPKIPPAKKNFIVGGPRFSLSPSDIQSVFPPSNHRGNFDNCLPHIVFTRATLPWEQMMSEKDEQIPWMALLLFDEKDQLTTTNLHIADLLSKEEKYTNLIGKCIYIDKDKKIIVEPKPENETCTVIDISSDLFNRLVPTKEELKFLAHSRKVDTQHKKAKVKSDASTDNDGWFSVVVGNRLPASGDEGIKNTAHLVSLEGLYTDNNGCNINSGCVRLISLASWSFFSIEEKYHFNDLASKLNVGTFGQLDDHSDPTKTSQNLGYEKLNHITRMGKTIKSWYRGPFVPYKYKCSKDLPEPPHPCADAALRYDPDANNFDVSYAAAWQLGRLLALQNRNFAVAIFNWRRKMLQLRRIDSNIDMAHERLVTSMGQDSTKDNSLSPKSTKEKLEKYIDEKIL